MAEGTVKTIEVDAPVETVFEVAADFDEYPDWASGVRSVEILDRDDQGRPKRVRYVVDGMMKVISYILVYEYEPPARLTWQAEPGDDIAEMVGSYDFGHLEEGCTEVVYALRVEPAFTIPGFLRRQAEKQVVTTALRGLKKRAESLAVD